MRRYFVRPFAASAAIATMLIGSATVASATHAVEIGNSATLQSKGAALSVAVEVTCDPVVTDPFPFPIPPVGASVSVQVSQRSGNRIAQGFGSANVVCDSTPHTVQVQVLAQQAPFKNGTALAMAFVTSCDATGCHSATDSEEISVRR